MEKTDDIPNISIQLNDGIRVTIVSAKHTPEPDTPQYKKHPTLPRLYTVYTRREISNTVDSVKFSFDADIPDITGSSETGLSEILTKEDRKRLIPYFAKYIKLYESNQTN